MTTIADIANGLSFLRVGLTALTTPSRPKQTTEEKPALMQIKPSELYPSRITNGSVRKLIDSGSLKKLGERLYGFTSESADVLYMETAPGTLTPFFDYKNDKPVTSKIVEERLAGLGTEVPKKPVTGALVYA